MPADRSERCQLFSFPLQARGNYRRGFPLENFRGFRDFRSFRDFRKTFETFSARLSSSRIWSSDVLLFEAKTFEKSSSVVRISSRCVYFSREFPVESFYQKVSSILPESVLLLRSDGDPLSWAIENQRSRFRTRFRTIQMRWTRKRSEAGTQDTWPVLAPKVAGTVLLPKHPHRH